MNRLVMQDKIRELSAVLKENEFPERILVVEYQSNDTCLLVATNFRAILLSDKFLSLSKVNVREFPYENVTDIEWAPGRLRHRITIRMDRKKEECYGLWRDGTLPARKMAEHLSSKLPGHPVTAGRDTRTTKAHSIEDIAQTFSLSGSKAKLKELPDVLEPDELPEHFLQAEYDDRHGLQVAGTMNRFGLLVGTDRQLIFIHKHLWSKREVHKFPYTVIDHVESSDGLLMGELKVNANRLEEIFKADRWAVNTFEKYLNGKTTN